jgi:pilus assembly protein CpaD
MGRLQMLQREFSFTNIAAGTLFLASTFLLGCSPPPHGSLEYSAAHPIEVVDRTFEMNISLASTDRGLMPENPAAFGQFVLDFHRRGKSHLFVFTAEKLTEIQRASLIDNMEEQLAALGVGQHQIISSKISPNSEQKPNVVVISFSGSTVKVPECGDWSGESGFNPTNMPTKNFGCSYQRNIGLMVTDPQDLIKSNPSLGTLDSATIERIIGQYELGKPTSSEPTGIRVFEEE